MSFPHLFLLLLFPIAPDSPPAPALPESAVALEVGTAFDPSAGCAPDRTRVRDWVAASDDRATMLYYSRTNSWLLSAAIDRRGEVLWRVYFEEGGRCRTRDRRVTLSKAVAHDVWIRLRQLSREEEVSIFRPGDTICSPYWGAQSCHFSVSSETTVRSYSFFYGAYDGAAAIASPLCDDLLATVGVERFSLEALMEEVADENGGVVPSPLGRFWEGQ